MALVEKNDDSELGARTMVANKYEEIGPLSHADAERTLKSSDPQMIAKALIAIGLHDHDWEWVQRHALSFLSHESEDVVSAAILSLAHMARLNRAIDKSRTLNALEKLSKDPAFSGRAQDAINDIVAYVKDE